MGIGAALPWLIVIVSNAKAAQENDNSNKKQVQRIKIKTPN
jgi:hypothetical protein